MDEAPSEHILPFYEQPKVQLYQIPVGGGFPLGIERVSNPRLGLGGAYGTRWCVHRSTALQIR